MNYLDYVSYILNCFTAKSLGDNFAELDGIWGQLNALLPVSNEVYVTYRSN